jgi:hypothetical protein
MSGFVERHSPPPVHETPVGVWLWFVLIFIINATWISMDVWLHHNHYEMLTTEMREGLRSWYGPFIFGGIVFTVAAFCWHMIYNLQNGR